MTFFSFTADCAASCLALLASAQRLMVSMTRPMGERKASKLVSAEFAVTPALPGMPALS